jgi:hypothetical protein
MSESGAVSFQVSYLCLWRSGRLSGSGAYGWRSFAVGDVEVPGSFVAEGCAAVVF